VPAFVLAIPIEACPLAAITTGTDPVTLGIAAALGVRMSAAGRRGRYGGPVTPVPGGAESC